MADSYRLAGRSGAQTANLMGERHSTTVTLKQTCYHLNFIQSSLVQYTFSYLCVQPGAYIIEPVPWTCVVKSVKIPNLSVHHLKHKKCASKHTGHAFHTCICFLAISHCVILKNI